MLYITHSLKGIEEVFFWPFSESWGIALPSLGRKGNIFSFVSCYSPLGGGGMSRTTRLYSAIFWIILSSPTCSQSSFSKDELSLVNCNSLLPKIFDNAEDGVACYVIPCVCMCVLYKLVTMYFSICDTYVK